MITRMTESQWWRFLTPVRLAAVSVLLAANLFASAALAGDEYESPEVPCCEVPDDDDS